MKSSRKFEEEILTLKVTMLLHLLSKVSSLREYSCETKK